MKKMHLKRLTALALGLSLMASALIPGVSAADEASATVDTEKPVSLTLYKYDTTTAAQDGAWDVSSYVSTGSYDSDVNAALSKYAIQGVEFSYIRLGQLSMYKGASKDGQQATIPLYGFTENTKTDSNQDTFRIEIRRAIDDALRKEPQDFEAFLRQLREAGYEIKTGKYTAVKGTGQQRFIRFHSLGAGYTDEDIRAVIAGKAVHRPKQKSIQVHQVVRFSLIFDLQQKLKEKGPAYERWASVFNLKQMANVMLFLNENHIDSMEALVTQAEDMHQRTDSLQAQLRQCDDRLSEIKALKTNIINYSKTRDTYVAYRKAGYSKKFLEAHREDILIHKAAKQAFEGLEHIPRVKELNAEYAQIQAQRSELRSELQAARKKSREYELAKENIRMFFEQDTRREEERMKGQQR